MTKKIIAVITSVVLCLTMSVSVFAADFDLGGILDSIGIGGSDGSSSIDISGIIDEETKQEIINAVTSADGVVDITSIVMEIVTKVTSGDLQEMGKAELLSVITSTVDGIANFIKGIYDNKDLIIKYDPLKVVDNLFGTNTGALTTAKESTTTEDELVIGPGDVDGDGKITSADARLILRRAALIVTFTSAQDALADVDKDGKVTAADARIVLRVSAGLQTMPV